MQPQRGLRVLGSIKIFQTVKFMRATQRLGALIYGKMHARLMNAKSNLNQGTSLNNKFAVIFALL